MPKGDNSTKSYSWQVFLWRGADGSGGWGWLIGVGLGRRFTSGRENRQNIKSKTQVQQTSVRWWIWPLEKQGRKQFLNITNKEVFFIYLVSTAVYYWVISYFSWGTAQKHSSQMFFLVRRRNINKYLNNSVGDIKEMCIVLWYVI